MCCAQYVGQYISKCVPQHDYAKHMTQTKLLVSQGSLVLPCVSAHSFFQHYRLSLRSGPCAFFNLAVYACVHVSNKTIGVTGVP